MQLSVKVNKFYIYLDICTCALHCREAKFDIDKCIIKLFDNIIHKQYGKDDFI